MTTAARFVFSFLAAYFIQAQAFGAASSSTALTDAAQTSIKIYSKGVANSEMKLYTMGFSAKFANGGIVVDVFAAESPIDVTDFHFVCTEQGTDCKFDSAFARCLYYARPGGYVVQDFVEAMKQSLQLVKENSSSENINELKFWQVGHDLFGYTNSSDTSVQQNFQCRESFPTRAQNLRCLTSEEPGTNAP